MAVFLSVPEERNALLLASEAGNLDAIQKLYDQNRDVLLVPFFQRDTALHIAARNGHQNIVEWILQKNPSSLHIGHQNIVEWILQKNQSFLHIAARDGHSNPVKWFLEKKRSLATIQNKDGNTPLHEAAKSGSPGVVNIFLRLEESVFYGSNKFGETALVIASQYGHLGIVELLLDAKSSEYRVTASDWDRSLREAAYRGYKDVVVALLDKAPKWFFRQKGLLNHHLNPFLIRMAGLEYILGTPILHVAVQGGQVETVRAMLTHLNHLNHRSWRIDVSMTEMDEYGRCAIHVAAMKGHWEIIHEFTIRMPDCADIRSSDDKSVLHFAVEYNQIRVVENLLANRTPEKAAEMVSRDHDGSGNTALHLAAMNGASLQILEILLPFKGDNINALNSEGMTALDIASAAPQRNANCAIITEKLEGAGGIRSSLRPKSHTTTSDASDDLKKKADADATNTHMVVASLIATITFAAMFQIPGGIEDEKESMHYGAAKLAFDKVFRLFIFSDTVAFTASITVVVGWLIKEQIQERNPGSSVIASLSDFSEASLLLSIFWTVLAFLTATITVIIPHNLHNLKSKDKVAFKKYELLLGYEISLAVCTPLLVLAAYFALKKSFRYKMCVSSNLSHSDMPLLVYGQMGYILLLVFCYVFK